ncbi:MAG: C4-type zinc ribbon domain-containing protein [Spirochaetales bacterium]|jgi:predicted  nucleic acid-binding Zn-ribbon protein|nr:C4-type zinc ribbon domain-containing protein [Spirochaetales bacterium]
MIYEDLIEKLKNLQNILSRKFEIEAEIHDIPKSLATKTELVNRLGKGYVDKNDDSEQKKLHIKNLKEKMREAEEERERLEGQMDAIRTQREYEALDKEIRDASEKELQFRKELQKAEKELEELSIALEKEESLIKEQEEELEQERAKIKTEIDSRKKQLSQIEKDEAQISDGLDSDILFKFERIIRNKSGSGIVPLKRGVCSGCHMILPMQFVNDVRLLSSMDRQIEGSELKSCPYCSRVLFFQEDGEDVFYQEPSENIFDMDDIEDDGDGDEDYDDEDVDDEEGDGDSETEDAAEEEEEEEV